MSMVGNRFAYRDGVRASGVPVRPVEVTKEGPPRSNKARVRWLDGEYEGLEEWVPKIRLLAPWEEAEALLEDERRMLAAVEASEEDASDEVTWEAVGEVFGIMSRISDPSEEIILGYKAIEEDLLVVQNLEATARRLGLDKEEMLAEPYAFVDRSGWYKAPFQTAVKVAKHCCQRFPREVLGRIKRDEDELRQELVGQLPWTWPFGCSRSMLQALDNFARRTSMTRRQKDPLRALTEEERHLLVRISRSHAEPASYVARAKALLTVAEGKSYTEAAKEPRGVARGTPSRTWSRAST
jgi:hypothetical protein